MNFIGSYVCSQVSLLSLSHCISTYQIWWKYQTAAYCAIRL